MRTSHLLVSLALVSTTAVAAPASPDKAGQEFGYFVGTWKCKEAWTKSPISEQLESTSTLVASNNTDGVWIAWSYVQDGSAKNAHPIKGNDLWGYDPDAKQYIREKADNFAPGHLTHLTSKGFVGDTVSWEGPVPTPKGPVPFKHSFKKLDAKTIEGKLYIGGQAFYSSTCTKQ